MAVATPKRKASSAKKKTGRREYGKGKKRDVKRNIPTDLIPLENETWLLQPIAVTMMRHDYSLIQIRILVSIVEKMQQKLRETEEHTKDNTAMTMVVALSYSARWEIVKAVKDIVDEKWNPLISRRIGSEDITEEVIAQHLQTSFMPDPDLLIRTGGELRVSNFLLWQIAYSELYFCDTYWPDFDEEDLHKAIISYQSRQRRFGKTEKQIENENQQG